MDKITSHIIQINLNPRSLIQGLGYQGLGFRDLGLKGLRGLGHVSLGGLRLESLGGIESSPWSRIFPSWIRDPVSEARGLIASRALTWACELLGLMKVDS